MKLPWSKPCPEDLPLKDEEARQITFSSADEPLERAAKIWAALGFVNDRSGMAVKMAAYLAMYREWDREKHQ